MLPGPPPQTFPYLLKHPFGGGDAFGPGFGLGGHIQCPARGLEDGLRDVVGVLPVGHGDVERDAAVDRHGPPELPHQLGLQRGPARGKLNFKVKMGAVAQVQGYLGQSFVHGHPGLAEAAHPWPGLEGFFEGLAQADADVLHGVVLVHLQVAFGLYLQVEIAVGRKQVQHMVKKRDAGLDRGFSPAIEGKFQLHLGFPGLALDAALGRHGGYSPLGFQAAIFFTPLFNKFFPKYREIL